MVPVFSNDGIGQRIKTKRLELRITQEELAARLGISPQHISAIERNNRLPSVAFLAGLAENLNVTIDFLVVGKHPAALDLIEAVTADNEIPGDAKNALISLIKVLRKTSPKQA